MTKQLYGTSEEKMKHWDTPFQNSPSSITTDGELHEARAIPYWQTILRWQYNFTELRKARNTDTSTWERKMFIAYYKTINSMKSDQFLDNRWNSNNNGASGITFLTNITDLGHKEERSATSHLKESGRALILTWKERNSLIRCSDEI